MEVEDLYLSFFKGQNIPLVVERRDTNKQLSTKEFLGFIKNNRPWLESTLHTNGAVLFRGFEINGVEEFDSFHKAFSADNDEKIDYSGGISPRTKLSKNVYNSTEWAKFLKISLHNELAYNQEYPRYIVFHCVNPADTGGETPIADCRKVTKEIDQTVKDKFYKKEITYKRYYYKKNIVLDSLNKFAKAHKTWMEVFNTKSRTEVEEKCSLLGYQFQWDHEGGVYITNTLPAYVEHPDTKENVWFNQAHTFNAYRRNIGFLGSTLEKIFYPTDRCRVHQASFGDGDAIPKSDIMKIHDAFDKNMCKFQWQANDIMMLDNILTAHGRSSFSGPRKILTAMANTITV